jgi:hypothetical protein
VHHPEHLLVGDTLERPRHPVTGVVEDDVDLTAAEGSARGLGNLLWVRDVSASRTTLGSAASSVSLDGVRIVAMTVHPRAENSFTEARPSPEEVPVMKIVPGPSVFTVSSLRRPALPHP